MNKLLILLAILTMAGCVAQSTYNVLKTKPVRILGPDGKECIVGQSITKLESTTYLTKPPCNVTIIEDHEPRKIQQLKELKKKGLNIQ